MNKERMAYIAPTSELLVVRFEQAFLTGSVNAQSSLMPTFTLDDEEDW